MTAARRTSTAPWTSSSRSTAACARSNRAKATALWPRSRAPATRSPAPWTCSGPTWHRSSYASVCTPAKCSCGTRATTRARPSTSLRGCAIWHTVARRAVDRHEPIVVEDRLPDGAWLTDLGSHPAAGSAAARSDRAAVSSRSAQRFPTLAHGEPRCRTDLPAQLTSFIGRGAQIADMATFSARTAL